MAQPPYMNATGLISKIFGKIAEAQKPDRFTTDFLTSVIGYGSGSARPVIPLLKRLNFLQADGTPTQLYARFRNSSERSSAMLEGIRAAYPEIFARSEYAHHLAKDKLRELVVEVTGLEKDNQIVPAIVGTFLALKAAGGVNDETRQAPSVPDRGGTVLPVDSPVPTPDRSEAWSRRDHEEVGLNLSYTINLNLPPSPDPEVFNAIFKALKEHLLGKT